MGRIRRHLRPLMLLWALGQLVAVATALPRECCGAHGPDHAAPTGCGTSARGAQCPMRAADGTPCPMHRDDRARDCSIRGTCAAPSTALAGLLAQPALVPAFITLPPDRLVTVGALPPRPSIHFGAIQPDPPPPRG